MATRGRPRKIVAPAIVPVAPKWLKDDAREPERKRRGAPKIVAKPAADLPVDPHLAWLFDKSPLPDPQGRGKRAVDFIRSLKHPKSTAKGRAFELVPFQERLVRRIYGDTDASGRRRIKTVFVLLPRGNRKTALGAALTLLHTIGPEKRPGGQVIAAALDRQQARIAFQEAVSIIREDPALTLGTHMQDARNRFADRASGAVLEAISADAGTHHGKTPVFLLADEIHAWRSHELWSVLRTGLTKSPETLAVVISTAGRGRHGLAFDLHQYARKVASGEIKDPTFLPVLFETPPDLDWRDERVWHRANPGLRYGFPDLAGLRQLAREAAMRPAEIEAFKQLHLNMWLDGAASPWLDMEAYDQGAEPIDEDGLEGRECWVGVDLSSTGDLTAIVACFPDGERYLVKAWFFCPEEGIRKKAELDRAPYDRWSNEGFLTATPGAVVDLRIVESTIRDICERYTVREIAFDPYGARTMIASLLEDGFPVVEMRQGWATMSPAIKALETAILSRNLVHAGNPVLRWCFTNVVVETDKAENLSFHKGKARDRIDGAVACAMAVGRASQGSSAGSIYENVQERPQGLLFF